MWVRRHSYSIALGTFVGLLLLVAVQYSTFGQEASITVTDDTIVRGTVVGLEGGDKLLILPSDGGEVVKLELEEVVVADYDRAAEEVDKEAFEFRLKNGDLLPGVVISGTRREVVVMTNRCGKVSIPLTNLQSIGAVGFQPTLEQEVTAVKEKDHDVILTRDGDVAVGVVESVGADGIVLKSEVFGQVIIPLRRIGMVRFAQYAVEDAEPSYLILVVFMTDGARLTGRLTDISEGTMHLRTLMCGDVRIQMDALKAFYVKNGRFVYLSDLTPVTVTEEPYFQGDIFLFPYQKDLTCTGSPMTLNGKRYFKGLGVHSRCKLTYRLNGEYSVFVSDVGVDDEVLQQSVRFGGIGSVVFRVIVDGQAATKDIVKKPGQPPDRVRVDVRGAQELTLVVDWGDDYYEFDRANWAGARLVK